MYVLTSSVDISRNKNNSRAPAAIGRLISCRRPGVSYASSISEIFAPSGHVRPNVRTLARINFACNERRRILCMLEICWRRRAHPGEKGPWKREERRWYARENVVDRYNIRYGFRTSSYVVNSDRGILLWSIMRENYYFRYFFFLFFEGWYSLLDTYLESEEKCSFFWIQSQSLNQSLKKNPRFLFSFDQHFYSSLHEILFFAGIKYFIRHSSKSTNGNDKSKSYRRHRLIFLGDNGKECCKTIYRWRSKRYPSSLRDK